MPRWEAKLAPGIPGDCHLSPGLGGSELQPPTWSKQLLISRIEEGIIPEAAPMVRSIRSCSHRRTQFHKLPFLCFS